MLNVFECVGNCVVICVQVGVRHVCVCTFPITYTMKMYETNFNSKIFNSFLTVKTSLRHMSAFKQTSPEASASFQAYSLTFSFCVITLFHFWFSDASAQCGTVILTLFEERFFVVV